MKTLTIILASLFPLVLSSQDIVLGYEGRTKTIDVGKYIELELIPEIQADCCCNLKTVYGQLVGVSDVGVILNVVESIDIQTEDDRNYRNRYKYDVLNPTQETFRKDHILSITKMPKPKSKKASATWSGIGALVFVGGAITSANSLFVNSESREDIALLGLAEIGAGTLIMIAANSRKRFVISRKSQYRKAKKYQIK